MREVLLVLLLLLAASGVAALPQARADRLILKSLFASL